MFGNVIRPELRDVTTDAEPEKQRKFTGEKLDWMSALSADPEIDARAFEVGFCIAQHVNKETGKALLADQTIANKTGIPRTWVWRARKRLLDRRWMKWTRTRTANIYELLGDNMNGILDLLSEKKDRRDEARNKRRTIKRDTPQVDDLNTSDTPRVENLERSDTPQVDDQDVPQVDDQDTPRVENIHLRDNTLGITPLRASLSERGSALPPIPNHSLAEARLTELLGQGDLDVGSSRRERIGLRRFQCLANLLGEGRLFPEQVHSAIAACQSQATQDANLQVDRCSP